MYIREMEPGDGTEYLKYISRELIPEKQHLVQSIPIGKNGISPIARLADMWPWLMMKLSGLWR